MRLKDASALSAKGLKVLKQHKVVDLTVNGLKITVDDLISCLGDWSLQNLRSLSVARGSFMDCSRYLRLTASRRVISRIFPWRVIFTFFFLTGIV